MRDAKRWIVDGLLLSVVTIWGFNFSVIKFVYRDIHPIAFNALRFTVASLAMVFLLLWRGGNFHIDRKDRRTYFALGLIGTAIYQFLFVLGLQRTRAGNSGLIMALTPIFAYLVGIAAKRERFKRAVLLGILLSLAGVSIIMFYGSSEVSFAGTARGDLMMLGAAFCWGAYTAGASPMINKYGATHLTVLSTMAGAAILVPLSLPWILDQNWASISGAAWLGVLYATFGGIVYSYFIWAYALGEVGVAPTAIFSNVTPVIAVAGGWMLLGEPFTLSQIAGVVLILAGVFIVRARKPEARCPPL